MGLDVNGWLVIGVRLRRGDLVVLAGNTKGCPAGHDLGGVPGKYCPACGKEVGLVLTFSPTPLLCRLVGGPIPSQKTGAEVYLEAAESGARLLGLDFRPLVNHPEIRLGSIPDEFVLGVTGEVLGDVGGDVDARPSVLDLSEARDRFEEAVSGFRGELGLDDRRIEAVAGLYVSF